MNEQMDINEAMPEVVEEQVHMSAIQKVVGIVFSPIKTLKAIKTKPSYLLPMIIIVVLPLLYTLLFWSDMETAIIEQLEVQFETMDMELTQEMLDMQLGITRILTPVGVVISALIGGLISGLYYFICAKIAKSDVKFSHMVSLSYHIMVIGSLVSLLNIILSLVGLQVNMNVPITSLASILPSSMSTSVIFGVCLMIEVFSIWSMVINYFGLQIVGKMSKKAALISILIAFIFGIAMVSGSLALSNVMSSLQG